MSTTPIESALNVGKTAIDLVQELDARPAFVPETASAEETTREVARLNLLADYLEAVNAHMRAMLAMSPTL